MGSLLELVKNSSPRVIQPAPSEIGVLVVDDEEGVRKFVERVRDTSDRRKIFIRIRPESLEPLIPKYEGVGKAYRALAEHYNDKDLELICDYMERTSDIAGQELRKIIATNRQDSL